MKQKPYLHPERTKLLLDALSQRILVIDGAMGTMLQNYHLDEAGYRGERFACGHEHDLKGNNDLLSLSRPEIVSAVHKAYLDAGADLVETNTFNATRISQADYRTEALTYELNFASAKLARAAADVKTAETPERPRFVIGAIGPTSRTASISPDVNNPGFRNVSFDELADAYEESARGLIDGGSDVLMVETIFDTLNAKAALFAIERLFDKLGARVPVMISGTITDLSGRTLSGQTPEAFYNSVQHVRPLAVGLNCALGAKELRPYIDALAQVADTYVSTHPNAGLPNAFGEYDELPDQTASVLGEFARAGLVNFVGGCCGTTPDHIRAIAQAVAGVFPRVLPSADARAA